MRVLKDMCCEACERVSEAFVVSTKETSRLDCVSCGRRTLHRSRCNGGVRLGCNTDEGRDWSGDVEVIGSPTLTERTTGEPVRTIYGEDMAAKARANSGIREERRDRNEFEARKRKGRVKIHV